MELKNNTIVREFILLGLSERSGLQISLLTFYVLLYIVALMGNVVIVLLISIDQHLHTPMYFFLWILSLLEIVNILNILPPLALQIFISHTSISKVYCFIQFFLFYYIISNVVFLLPIMSCDRYVAISNPLRYTTIMNKRCCIQLVIVSLLGSILCLLYPTIVIIRLPYCGPNIIDHFFCDAFEIMKLACTDTQVLQYTSVVSAITVLMGSLGLTVLSYSVIISTVLHIPSIKRRFKTFSTCSSHLTVVTICYGTAIFLDLSPALNISMTVYKLVQMMGTIISPLVNPFIYTLRNEDVRKILKKYIHG